MLGRLHTHHLAQSFHKAKGFLHHSYHQTKGYLSNESEHSKRSMEQLHH